MSRKPLNAAVKSADSAAKTQHPKSEKPRKNIRLAGLDGIRALAALAVLFYHTQFGFSGGFLGVDVFFVLSAFLITSLLVNEQKRTGKIYLKRFYLRRFRRLFPAVATTVLIVTPFAWIFDQDLLVHVGRQIIGALTFTFNWVAIGNGVNYFDHNNPELLRNMWSLAIEQQFYLLWPLAILFLIIGLPYLLRWVTPFALGMASMAWMYYLWQSGAGLNRIYMGTDTHAFSLMIGAVLACLFPLALIEQKIPSKNGAAAARAKLKTLSFGRGVLAWAGLAILGYLFFTVDDQATSTYPGMLLTAGIATCFVIQGLLFEVTAFNGPGRQLQRILELPALVWLGERSYSLYLWHWPLYLLIHQKFPSCPIWIETILVLGIGILAAHLSYVYVETPMRKQGILAVWRQWFSFKKFASSGLGASLITDLAMLIGAVLVVLPSTFVAANAPTKTSTQRGIEAGLKQLSEAQKLEKAAAAGRTDKLQRPAKPAPNQIGAAKVPGTGADAGQNPPAQSNGQGENDGASGSGSPGGQTGSKGTVPKQNEPSASTTPISPIPAHDGLPAVTGCAGVNTSQVMFIGDSITAAAGNAITQMFPGAYFDAKVSRAPSTGISILRSLKQSGQLRKYLVFALGTNGRVSDRQIDQLLEIMGPDGKIVIPTGYVHNMPSYLVDTNARVRRYAKQYPGRIATNNWVDIAPAHPEILWPDHTHPKPDAGGPVWAQLVCNSLKSML